MIELQVWRMLLALALGTIAAWVLDLVVVVGCFRAAGLWPSADRDEVEPLNGRHDVD